MNAKSAILILAYGTPDDLGDMKAYLLDIRGGRETPDALVEEMTSRYRAIGGSPLNRHTYAQAEALALEMERRGRAQPVYVGMRHWRPRIKDAVAQMHTDGVTEAVAIVMAPHYSRLSVGRYEAQVQQAQEELGSHIAVTMVRSWWRQPKLLQAFEEHVRAALERFDENERTSLKLVFTAHSLPARILDMGDSYDEELKGHAHAMADRLGVTDWSFAYQSAGASNEPWLGPALEEEIPRLAGEGCRNLLVVPLGFVCDHVEILFDIDMEAKEIAKAHGVRMERTESMNTAPLFIEAVADAIEQAPTSHEALSPS